MNFDDPTPKRKPHGIVPDPRRGASERPFNSMGTGYDYKSARAAGMGQGQDQHWSSREPRTGMILKGRGHPSWSETVKGEKEKGYEIYKNNGDGRYYSRPAYNFDDVTPEAIQQDKDLWKNTQLQFARTLYGEGRGEGEAGMEAIANVLRNRRADTNYPPNYPKVITQPNQFSIWNDPKSKEYKALNKMKPDKGDEVFDKAYGMAGRFMEDKVPYEYDSTGSLMESDHYLNPVETAKQYKSGKIPEGHWSKDKGMKLQGVLGNHNFYKDKTRPASGFNTGRDRYLK